MDPFTPLWPEGPLFAPAPHAALSTDSVLLADFVRFSGNARGIDLGCASGAILLMLLFRSDRLRMTGLELQPDAAELACRAVEMNRLSERSEICCGDLREYRTLFPGGCFDFAVSNPPYYPSGTGALSPDPARAGARSELSCTLADVCDAAAFLCRTGGNFFSRAQAGAPFRDLCHPEPDRAGTEAAPRRMSPPRKSAFSHAD